MIPLNRSCLIKVDFTKAFDCIDHNFLIYMLKRLGLNGPFLDALIVLLSNATSRVEFNGTYFADFQLNRGICKGCPLSSLLFVLATQPLLDFLEHKRIVGDLLRILISLLRSVAYKMYVDDLICFFLDDPSNLVGILDILKIYKAASQASVNLKKSCIIPLYASKIHDWITRVGCKVAGSEEIHKYLDSPLGWNTSKKQIADFCLAKIADRISKMDGNDMTFVGRLMVCRHILTAFPVYLQLCLHVNRKYWVCAEAMMNRFIWGHAKIGKHKTPLVAWHKVCQDRSVGGLGLRALDVQAQALYCKWIWFMLNKPQSDLVTIVILESGYKIKKELNATSRTYIKFCSGTKKRSFSRLTTSGLSSRLRGLSRIIPGLL